MDIITEIEKWDEVELFWGGEEGWLVALITYDGSGIGEGRAETLEKAYKQAKDKVT